MKLLWIITVLFTLVGGEILKGTNIQYMLDLGRRTAESIIDKSGGNTKCAQDLRAFISDVFRRKLWAIKMIDACGKLQAGLISGNLYQLGNYDQCLSIEENRNNSLIQGQYCSVLLFPKENLTSQFFSFMDAQSIADFAQVQKSFHVSEILKNIKLAYGLCIPKSCSIENLQTIWNYAENTLGLPMHALFIDLLCNYKGKPIEPFNVDQYVYVFFGGVFLLVIIGTFYDLIINRNKGKNDSLLVAFSVYSNCKKIFSINVDVDNLTCLYGMKVISMLWIIQGHRFAADAFSCNVNSFYLFEWRKNIENTIINAASVSVDTFFTLSGLLLSYSYLKYTSKGQKLKLSSLYAYRFFRITAPLTAIILIYMSVLKHLSDGPAWPLIMRKVSSTCYQTWWATFFHISNFLKLDYQCIEQAWFLGVDTQLYLFSPLILFNFRKYPIRVFLGMFATCLLSMVYSFAITIKNNYGAMFFEGNRAYYENIYMPTFVRMPSWLIGVASGYFIYQTKGKNFKMSQFFNIILWFLSLASLSLIILIHIVFTREEYNVIRSACYNAFARPIWALAISWISFSCINGYGGFINTFLSLPIFRILVKLTYSLYLTHIAVIILIVGGQRGVGHFSNMRAFHEFWGDLVACLVVSLGFCLMFESPILAIGRILMKRQINIKMLKKKKKVEKNKKPIERHIFWIFSYILQEKNKMKMEKVD